MFKTTSRHVSGAVLTALLVCGPFAEAGALCIRSLDIDHTDRPNDQTIVFYMKGGNVFRNDLPQRCSGLKIAINGFTYEPTNPGTDELCDNLSTFRVNDGTGIGQVCMFGAFTKTK